jgi:hypothetical protein
VARVLNPGDSVKGYEIVSLLNRGAMAISYQARSAARPRVFLKQYKSPSPTVGWFEEYQKLQKEVTRRANLETLRSFCVAPFDVFVARAGGDAYFQVFDFVDGGKDLSHLIEEFRTRNDEETRRRRLVLGRRLAANIRFCTQRASSIAISNRRISTSSRARVRRQAGTSASSTWTSRFSRIGPHRGTGVRVTSVRHATSHRSTLRKASRGRTRTSFP